MNRKFFTTLGALLFLALSSYAYNQFQKQKPEQFQIIALDVGQGDAHLITFRNGQKMLVDCGPDKKIIERLGSNLRFTDDTIDYLLISHPHLDHYGGCIDTVSRYTVKHIIYNTEGSPQDTYWQSWQAAMKKSGAEIIRLQNPDTWHIGSTTLDFLTPDPTLAINSKDVNDSSIVFRIHDEQTNKTALFTGDAEIPTEKALLDHYCTTPSAQEPDSRTDTLPDGTRSKKTGYLAPCPRLQSGILKAGHHGSDSSSSDDFLKAVAPKQAVVSCGMHNKFNHPSLRTVRRFERLGITVLRTDQKGDILF
jgi:competence protein ComEC